MKLALEGFDGPLDLLLELARTQKVDIRRISIVALVDQYIAVLEAQDVRLELRHAPVGGVQGVWGLQSDDLQFSALGEEAFVPSTRTRSQAVFALEELALKAVTFSAGLRVEQARVRSEGDAPGAVRPRFGDATSRRFQPASYSLGARSDIGQGWQVLATIGHTERAPAYYELYANGVHVATRAYERGDPQQALERSRHAELGLAWRSESGKGAHSFKASVFETRFANFIALDASGVDITVAGAPGEVALRRCEQRGRTAHEQAHVRRARDVEPGVRQESCVERGYAHHHGAAGQRFEHAIEVEPFEEDHR